MYRRYGERRILTPGPTALPQRVKAALVRETTNPDLDPRFFEEYRETVDMARRLIGAGQGRVYIWAGVAVLGLEAAVANSVKPGTKVLVVDNGVYGSGFARPREDVRREARRYGPGLEAAGGSGGCG